jgi:adenosine deaminase
MNNLFRELKKLPKIELHAHLSGSVRNSTIIELIKNELLEKRSETQDELNIEKEIEQYQINENKSLKDCFTIFSHLHRLLNNKENLERVTREILKDFADENVIYLELRTTPRVIYDSFSKKVILTKRDYIETIINEIKEFEKCSDMIVRLILSIDRSKTIQEARFFLNEI